MAEEPVADTDYNLGIQIFQSLSEKTGHPVDALQALLWFAEKDYYARNGWARGSGAKLSTFAEPLEQLTGPLGHMVIAPPDELPLTFAPLESK